MTVTKARRTDKNSPPASERLQAAGYIRISTAGQDDLLSPEAQSTRIERFGDRYEADVIEFFEDIAISGASIEKRHGFKRMIAKAISPEHPFDIIIVYDLSRFTRNTRDLLNLLHLLRNHGVQLQSVTQPHSGNPADDEAWIHASASDQAMLPATARKTRDSQFEAVKRGYHPGGVPPFGLTTEEIVIKTERSNARGTTRVTKTSHSVLVQHPEEAPHVVIMFEMNNTGHSTADIAEWLTKQGVKTRERNDFTPGAVLAILHNPRMAGRQERGKASASPYLPHDEMEINEEAHEGIVSWEVYELAQETLAARTPETRSPRSNASINRFAELAECGECGQPMHIAKADGRRTLVCKRKKIRASYCPNSHRENLEDVQEAALKILLENLRDEKFLNEHVDNVLELNGLLVKEQTQQKAVLDRRAAEVQEAINGLLDTAETARKMNRPAEEVLDRLDERRAEKRLIQEEKQRLINQTEGFMSYVNDRERIIANAMDVRTIIETDEPQVANTFVRLFVKKLVIKDHIGTIHFTVPPLDEGPQWMPESFGLGKHLFARPLGGATGDSDSEECQVFGYPRVGGATPPRDPPIASPCGLSPRGRGNPTERLLAVMRARSIPAWAGQPIWAMVALRPMIFRADLTLCFGIRLGSML